MKVGKGGLLEGQKLDTLLATCDIDEEGVGSTLVYLPTELLSLDGEGEGAQLFTTNLYGSDTGIVNILSKVSFEVAVCYCNSLGLADSVALGLPIDVVGDHYGELSEEYPHVQVEGDEFEEGVFDGGELFGEGLSDHSVLFEGYRRRHPVDNYLGYYSLIRVDSYQVVTIRTQVALAQRRYYD